VTNASQLSAAIDAESPGDTVELTYLREGETKMATVTLGTRPS
jgi:S1-C subfamily serine protease